MDYDAQRKTDYWFDYLTLTIDNDKGLLDRVLLLFSKMLKGDKLAADFDQLMRSAGFDEQETTLGLRKALAHHYFLKILIDYPEMVNLGDVAKVRKHRTGFYGAIQKALKESGLTLPNDLATHYGIINNKTTKGKEDMSITNASKAFDSVTIKTVYGVDINALTEGQAIDAINKVNREIDDLESVQVDSKRIQTMVTGLKKQKVAIVKLLDSGKLSKGELSATLG